MINLKMNTTPKLNVNIHKEMSNEKVENQKGK